MPDTTYGPKVYKDQGGDRLVVASGGSLVVESGGAIDDRGSPVTATISPAAGGSNVCLVTITVKDGQGNAVAGPVAMDVTLSDAATGAGLTGTTASGAVAAGASGVDLATLVSKKALRVQTTAAGVYTLSITDTAKTGFYVCVFLGGRLAVVGAQLQTANYG